MTRAAAHATLTAVALAFVAAALLFGAAPGIDIAVSAFFFDAGHFTAQGAPWLELLRQTLWDVAIATALLSLALTLLQPLRRTAPRIATRVWSFIFLSYLIGPGLIVNGLLKAHWGRARPVQILDFGGTAQFTPPLEAAQECARNCSFVSGEAAGAITTALVLTLTFLAAIEAPRSRRGALAVTWILALVASGLRIAMGGHFLSDVVFSALICAMVTLSLYLLLRVDRVATTATFGNLAKGGAGLLQGGGALLASLGARIRR